MHEFKQAIKIVVTKLHVQNYNEALIGPFLSFSFSAFS